MNNQFVKETTIINSERLKRETGLDLLIASETFQTTGSFKFRAAYNLASSVPNDIIITASSGNFGQALACACSLLNKKCIVVMPENSASIKIASTKYWGAIVELVDTTTKPRAVRVAELSAENPNAYIASAYDDDYVINGNASLGTELASRLPNIDYVVAPTGGGGLCSGIIKGLREAGKQHIKVIAAEPALANDAAQSMRKGEIVSFQKEAQTIADGARTLSLGKRNFEILKDGLNKVIEVSEEAIERTVRTAFLLVNLKLEPTGALALAAVIENKELFAGSKVVAVASGGNVDPDLFAKLIAKN